jgi:hypothetical protein
MKNIALLIIALVLALVAYALWQGAKDGALLPGNTPSANEQGQTVPAQDEQDDMTVCIQVITPARDPKTGTITEFPTPCDVPDGWEIIINEEPSLEVI